MTMIMTMRSMLYLQLTLALLTYSNTHVHAFVVTNTRRNNLSLHHATTTTKEDSVQSSSAAAAADRIRSSGCGIPVVNSGNCELFDPEEEGKLQGTGDLGERLRLAHKYVPVATHSASSVGTSNVAGSSSGSSSISADLEEAQHWLEYLDTDVQTNEATGPPTNFAKPQKPVTATVLGQAKIIGDDAPGDIRHIIMRLPHGFHYVEGQSLSVIPPGLAPNGKKHKPRLYSIASTRYGDLLDGSTVSLCVRRAEFYDPVTGVKDDSKKGVCSNFLCDSTAGAEVQVAGPVGKTMLLPRDSTTDVIMVATGTGVAPFRGFMHRLFMENTVARHLFDATAWLILGVPTTSGLLYEEEFNAMKANAQDGTLKINYAISREMKNLQGGKYYVQDVIAENADEIFRRLENGACMYFCGLKGMMPSITETFEKVSMERGIEWNAFLKKLKDNHQWHVEVY